MSTTQPVGFSVRLRAMTGAKRSRYTPLVWSVIQQSDPARELRIGTAPARDPCLDAKEVEVATGEIRPNLSDVPTLDGSQSVLRNPRRHRDLADPSCAAGLGAPRAQRVPANHVFAGIEVRLYARKRRDQSAADFAVKKSDLRAIQNGAAVRGQLLLEPYEGGRSLHRLIVACGRWRRRQLRRAEL